MTGFADAAGCRADDAMAETAARPFSWSPRSGVLERVFRASVVPILSDRHKPAPRPAGSGATHDQAAILAGLLIEADPGAARDLIATLLAEGSSIWPLYRTLFEPAARLLGDRWEDDVRGEAEVTLGLSRLQTAARQFGRAAPRRAARVTRQPAVLLAPEPGEGQGLGAALDCEVLWHAGWQPRCEFPASDTALQDLVAATWFDALDLSLSVAFRRESDLARLARTIAKARRASRNPALAVVVGGRVFVEEGSAGARVGADMACATALDIEQAIRWGMARRAAPATAARRG